MNRESFPIYVQAIEAHLKNESGRFSKLLKSETLSRVEKSLLQIRLLFRSKAWEAAVHKLETLPTGKSPFFEGERLFLMGSACFYLGRYEQAALCNTQAVENYRECEDRRGQFISLYNLSVDYSSLGCEELSDFFMGRAENHAFNVDEKNLVWRAIACGYSKNERYPEAVAWIERALSQLKDLRDSDRFGTETVAADIYARAGDLERSYSLLSQIYRQPYNRETERTKFELKLIRCLVDNSALSAPPRAPQSSPEYFLKWRILHSLQSGERDQAKSLWVELTTLRPKIYSENFGCLSASEGRTAFMRFLSRLRFVPSKIISPPSILKGQARILYQALSSSGVPVRKEELIEQIWKIKYDPSLDARFYKLIERFRKISGIEIQCRNRAYLLIS